MGVCNSPYIFQKEKNVIFPGIEIVRTYIDDLLVINKGDWFDRLNRMDPVLENLIENGLKCNIEKLFFGQTNMEYLCFCVCNKCFSCVEKVDFITTIVLNFRSYVPSLYSVLAPSATYVGFFMNYDIGT